MKLEKLIAQVTANLDQVAKMALYECQRLTFSERADLRHRISELITTSKGIDRMALMTLDAVCAVLNEG